MQVGKGQAVFVGLVISLNRIFREILWVRLFKVLAVLRFPFHLNTHITVGKCHME